MTDRRPARRPGPGAVLWSTIALFAALFALITYQLAVGSDPSLNGLASASSRPVLVRKVIKRKVVTTVVPSPGANSVSSGPVSSSGYSSGSEPVTTSAS